MDRDDLKGMFIGVFQNIMENEEFDDKKKIGLIVLSHEIVCEFDPAVMAEGLDNYLIARHSSHQSLFILGFYIHLRVTLQITIRLILPFLKRFY